MKKEQKPYYFGLINKIILLIPILLFTFSLLFHTSKLISLAVQTICILCYSLSIFLGKKYKTEIKNYIFNISEKIFEKHQTNNDRYKIKKNLDFPKGIVIHCVDDNAIGMKKYVEFEEKLGKCEENTSWNKKGISKLPHSFIGYDKLGEFCIVNTLSYGLCGSMCLKGTNGTYDESHLQFVVCKNDNYEQDYFEKIFFDIAVQYCAYICKTRKLSYKSIISDKEAYDQGFASEFGILDAWLTSNSKTMDEFRTAVKNRLKGK